MKKDGSPTAIAAALAGRDEPSSVNTWRWSRKPARRPSGGKWWDRAVADALAGDGTLPGAAEVCLVFRLDVDRLGAT